MDISCGCGTRKLNRSKNNQSIDKYRETWKQYFHCVFASSKLLLMFTSVAFTWLEIIIYPIIKIRDTTLSLAKP